MKGDGLVGGHGRGPRRRRTGLRVALVTTMAVAAVALLAGLGMAATPQLVPAAVDPAAHSLLAAADGDLVEALRDKDVPDACRPPTRACVDLDNAKAWLLDANGVTRGPVEIRAGDDQTPTPRGQFTVQWKAKTYTSREYLRQMIAHHKGAITMARTELADGKDADSKRLAGAVIAAQTDEINEMGTLLK